MAHHGRARRELKIELFDEVYQTEPCMHSHLMLMPMKNLNPVYHQQLYYIINLGHTSILKCTSSDINRSLSSVITLPNDEVCTHRFIALHSDLGYICNISLHRYVVHP